MYIRPMFPIKATAELTGLTPETLRAWERRHGAVVPLRDAAGRRLYDAQMVDRLCHLHRLTGRGHPIRDLAALDDAALERLSGASRDTGYGGLDALPGQMLDAIADYRIDEFDRDLTVAITTLPVAVLVSRVVAPLLREVGVRWADGRLAIAQERLVSSLLRARLMSVLTQHPGAARPRVLFATLPGEPHELGLLGAGLHAHDAGASVLYLGTGLPAEELATVASRLDAAAVAVSSIDPGHAPQALAGMRALDAALEPHVPVWVGGGNARYLVEAVASPRIQAVIDPMSLAALIRRCASARRPLRTRRPGTAAD